MNLALKNARRIVVKVGSSLVTNEGKGVDAQAVGNLRRFQANPQSPVYAELVTLTRTTLGTVPVLRDALQPLQPGLISAWVYGSVARQTDTACSDIDLMLVGNDLLLSQVLATLELAEAQLGRKINPSRKIR